MKSPGQEMYEFAERLWPIPRSITGSGIRETLALIKEHLPSLEIIEVPSGTQVFDWIVPQEWRIEEARIIGPDGETVLDFRENNLHVVGYSTAVDEIMDLSDLQEHLYSDPEMPEAVPYITSYYQERWGFCMSHRQRESLQEGEYHVIIRSELFDGHLTYGELIIPGKRVEEILLSTYICHPSLANNELSGPVVQTYLSKWLGTLSEREYTYRIVFIPETIGSITYLSRNLEEMKERVRAGFNVTCVGDDRAHSFLPSRRGDTLADRIAVHVLGHMHPDYVAYSYLNRGSDERQYCSPGVDLPVCSVMRSKYCEYPEYHTSLDNLDLISPAGLLGGYEVLRKCIECLEHNVYPSVTTPCEPQLGKRGLYPTLSTKDSAFRVSVMKDLLAWSDGEHSLLEIAEIIHKPMWELFDLVDTLVEHDVLAIR